MKIKINEKYYEVVKNYRDAFSEDELKEKLTEYYESYDYILGDYAYGKLRLKGFNEKNNKNFKPLNDYSKINEYINDYCAYECKHFILKRL